MVSFAVRRTLSMIPVLIGVSMLTFLCMHLTPGGPVAAMLDPEQLDPRAIETIRHHMGLDKPLHIQYFRWLSSVVQGDLGRSYADNVPVTTKILARVPATLQLTLSALALGLIVAIPVGVLSAVKQYSWVDHALSLGTVVLISAPGFWLGLMAIFFFAGRLEWFPPSGIAAVGKRGDLISQLHHAVLPTVCLAGAFAARYVRFIRSEMLDVINEDYIRTARAKGLSEVAVFFRHALRNALIVPITLIGMSFGYLVSGSVTLEMVFAWPGVGHLAVASITRRDYPVTLGIALFVGVLNVTGNLIADLLYGWADPRIVYD